MTASRLALFLLLVSTSASAQTFLFSGHLDDGDQPANGSFTVGLAIKDGDTVLWDEEQPSVVVVDGNFAIDVGAVEPLDVAPPATARLVVTIDGDELPPAPLGRLAVAFNVGVAAEVSNASDADVVGDVTIDEALRVGDLASGGVAYPFAAITGVPADLADGDNGQDLTLAANSGLTLQSRTLSLGTTILGSKLAPGSISNINAVADVYSATNLNEVTIRTLIAVEGNPFELDEAR